MPRSTICWPDDSVDVVHVTSPNHAHYEHVKAILAAGKKRDLRETAGHDLRAIGRDGGDREAKRQDRRRLLQHPLLSAEPAGPRDGAGRRAWGTSGSSPGTTTRTGWPSPPIGTGGSRPTWAARCGPWAISARIGSTSPGFVTGLKTRGGDGGTHHLPARAPETHRPGRRPSRARPAPQRRLKIDTDDAAMIVIRY